MQLDYNRPIATASYSSQILLQCLGWMFQMRQTPIYRHHHIALAKHALLPRSQHVTIDPLTAPFQVTSHKHLQAFLLRTSSSVTVSLVYEILMVLLDLCHRFAPISSTMSTHLDIYLLNLPYQSPERAMLKIHGHINSPNTIATPSYPQPLIHHILLMLQQSVHNDKLGPKNVLNDMDMPHLRLHYL